MALVKKLMLIFFSLEFPPLLSLAESRIVWQWPRKCSNIFTVLQDTFTMQSIWDNDSSFQHIRLGSQLTEEHTYPKENFNRLRAGGSSSATWNVLSDDSEGSLIQTFFATVVLKQEWYSVLMKLCAHM